MLLLILAVAGGVFAQDITWSGEVRTGAKVDFGDGIENDAGEEATMIQADDDDVPTGVKTRLNAQVAGDSYGLDFGIQANIIGGDTSMSFYNAHGWLDFVNGMIKVRAGLIDPGVWKTRGPKDWNVSSGLGFRLEVMPIEGLNVGALLNYGGNNGSGMEIGDFAKETAFGFSYENAAMMGLYATAAYKLDSEADEDFIGDDADAFSTLIFGFGLNPMEALAVKVEGKVDNLGKYGDYGWMWFVEDVSYQVMAALKAGIRMDQQMASEDVAIGFALATEAQKKLMGDRVKDFEGYEMFLKFNPYAEYAVNDALLLHGEIPVSFADNGDKFGFATVGLGAWAKYTIGGAWIQGGYSFTKKMEDYGDSLAHTVRVLAGFSF